VIAKKIYPFLIKCFFVLCFLSLFEHLHAQSISGQVLNDEKEAIPFANIYVQQLQSGTAADGNGHFFLNLDKGDYDIVISAIGYENLSLPIIVGDDPLEQDYVLKSSSVELEEVVVKASKRDPAYAIIQNAIDHKKKYLSQVQSFRSQVYVKATEVISRKERAKREQAAKAKTNQQEEAIPIDPFEAAEKAKKQLANSLNLLEMQLTLNFQYPKKYKEERTAYKKYGSKDGLFIPRFGESDFNFYRNLVLMKGIAEVPLISPISRTAILVYKFKLESSVEEEGQVVHKIKVTPRKVGNSTFKGYIYINDKSWNINRLDLNVYKGALKLYDAFSLRQDYQKINDTLWIPTRQELTYETKQGRSKTFKGNTLLRYSDFEVDYPFPPRFFGNEVSIITKEAYERDTSYWQELRPEALSTDQQKVVSYRDSIAAIHNSKAYLDSVQTAFNKITFLDLVWDGVGFRNNEKKRNVFIGPIPSMIDFEIVGGFRIGPYASYFRRYENGRRLFANINLNIGLKNKDLQGSTYASFRYDPHRLADIAAWGDRSFESINSYDAFLNQLRSSNYIVSDKIGLRHRIEIFNGFYISLEGERSDRSSIEAYDRNSFVEGFLEQGDPYLFEGYQAFITDLRISYTPGQKFMTEPSRKVILGSPYPTFSIGHKKGWDGFLSSDVDFDFLDFRIEQDLILGVFGNSKYTIKTGTFVNTKDLRFIDLQRFRQSDPILYSNPLHSFQSLDTSLVASDWFFEVHHIHHFNGALINNIPFVKKLRIRAVAGGGFLWVRESDYRHAEIFVGVERTFKLGARRRLRIGTYGVFAESNHTQPKPDFKISLDLIDTWKKNWDF